jgi:hypothetical protein
MALWSMPTDEAGTLRDYLAERNPSAFGFLRTPATSYSATKGAITLCA